MMVMLISWRWKGGGSGDNGVVMVMEKVVMIVVKVMVEMAVVVMEELLELPLVIIEIEVK